MGQRKSTKHATFDDTAEQTEPAPKTQSAWEETKKDILRREQIHPGRMKKAKDKEDYSLYFNKSDESMAWTLTKTALLGGLGLAAYRYLTAETSQSLTTSLPTSISPNISALASENTVALSTFDTLPTLGNSELSQSVYDGVTLVSASLAGDTWAGDTGLSSDTPSLASLYG